MSSSPRRYATELRDAEWQILEPLIPTIKPPSIGRRFHHHEVLESAIQAKKIASAPDSQST